MDVVSIIHYFSEIWKIHEGEDLTLYHRIYSNFSERIIDRVMHVFLKITNRRKRFIL